MKSHVYESFPWWMALIGIALGAATYFLGAFILAGFGAPISILYLGYCAFVELFILRGSCIHCFYYGKVCGLGRGRVCSLLFKRGDPQKFIEREVSLREIVPDMLVAGIPVIGGIILLVRRFDWTTLLAVVSLAALATAGNAIVRGAFACRHCAQRELGCPAEKLFSKRRS